MTRVKFAVNSITRYLGGSYKDGKWVMAEVHTIKLSPVTTGSEENKAFFASTPSGSIEIGIVNPEAVKGFELNKEYYIDFTPAS